MTLCGDGLQTPVAQAIDLIGASQPFGKVRALARTAAENINQT
jgi:hypothetical protein